MSNATDKSIDYAQKKKLLKKMKTVMEPNEIIASGMSDEKVSTLPATSTLTEMPQIQIQNLNLPKSLKMNNSTYS